MCNTYLHIISSNHRKNNTMDNSFLFLPSFPKRPGHLFMVGQRKAFFLFLIPTQIQMWTLIPTTTAAQATKTISDLHLTCDVALDHVVVVVAVAAVEAELVHLLLAAEHQHVVVVDPERSTYSTVPIAQTATEMREPHAFCHCCFCYSPQYLRHRLNPTSQKHCHSRAGRSSA